MTDEELLIKAEKCLDLSKVRQPALSQDERQTLVLASQAYSMLVIAREAAGFPDGKAPTPPPPNPPSA